MARIRSINPEMFRDRALAALSYRAWRTYTGLITACDDYGYAADDPELIRIDAYPRGVDGITVTEVADDLAEMVSAGVICRFGAADEAFLHVVKWKPWQKPNKPTPSAVPKCPKHNPVQQSLFDELETPVGLPNGSGSTTGGVHLGVGVGVGVGEGVGGGAGGDPAPSPRGTRLPDDWLPSLDMLAWAKAEHPRVNAGYETEKFRDYWPAQSGAKARKVRWDLTWKTWIRNASERMTPARDDDRQQQIPNR